MDFFVKSRAGNSIILLFRYSIPDSSLKVESFGEAIKLSFHVHSFLHAIHPLL